MGIEIDDTVTSTYSLSKSTNGFAIHWLAYRFYSSNFTRKKLKPY